MACVWCFKRARLDIFALSCWLLATLRIEAYRDFPDSLWKGNSQKFTKKVQISLICMMRLNLSFCQHSF